MKKTTVIRVNGAAVDLSTALAAKLSVLPRGSKKIETRPVGIVDTERGLVCYELFASDAGAAFQIVVESVDGSQVFGDS